MEDGCWTQDTRYWEEVRGKMKEEEKGIRENYFFVYL